MLVDMALETGEIRNKRRRQRALFDGVAELYQASRRGYPPEIVTFAIETARLRPSSKVLEVGCGTGQLTGQLAAHGFTLTAIDIGPAMTAAARERLGRFPACLETVSFEEFDGPAAAFDLIVSATAFHWIDPDVKFTKSARLLKPGGWLALMATGERYDNPFGAALRDMWVAHSDGAWVRHEKAPEIDLTGAAGMFGSPVERSHSQRITLPAQTVISVETTRATFLSWPGHVRQGFTDGLHSLLGEQAEVPLTQETSLVMAPVLSGRGSDPGSRARHSADRA